MLTFAGLGRACGSSLTALACTIVLVACGGGGGGAGAGADTPAIPTSPSAPTTPTEPTVPATLSPPVPSKDAPSLITLAGDPGEPTAGGKSYGYGTVNAVITLTAKANLLSVEVEGEEHWFGYFQLPNKLSTLQVGHYESKAGWPLHDPTLGGVQWSGEGKICTASTATIDIDKVSYSNNELASIEMRFVQFCNEQSTIALRGTIRWAANDPTPRTQPLAIPSTLWRPQSSAVPSSGSYVYVTGELQNFIAPGETFLYKSSDADLVFSSSTRGVDVAVTSTQRWDMRFVPMAPQTKLLPGYYAFISGKNNPAFGFMQVGGGSEGHGCERNTGWFVVDQADYSGAQLTALDLRFEMTCGALPGLLRGQIHWRIGDPSRPAGPVNPMPASLWAPPANALPSSGNALYLESDPGDVVGRGLKVIHTNADALFTPARAATALSFNINGDQWWVVGLLPMSGLQRPEVGYYGNLGSNSALGTINVFNLMNNCGTGQTGWFAVDSVSYNSGGELTSIDLRFEQRCNSSSGSALRGRLRWTSTDTSRPTPPVNPPPGNLWAPSTGTVPAVGNYVYLESAANEYIGAGRSYLYTQANAVFSVAGDLDFTVRGDEDWTGNFRHIYSGSGWQAGYYANTRRASTFNPARGGLSWIGEARGCNVSNGWIVVDSVHYDTSGLHDIELRFEQYCDDSPAPLHGKLRWNRDDRTTPPGPLNPPPSLLWSAPAAKLPASGSYLYIESDATDFVGSGFTNQASTYVYPLIASRLLNFSSTGAIDFRFDSVDGMWIVAATPMISLSQLMPGYYPDTQQNPTANPAKGGLAVSGLARTCNHSHGWYAIDAIRFDNSKVVQLDMRFEQRCDEGAGGSLRGQIHWTP